MPQTFVSYVACFALLWVAGYGTRLGSAEEMTNGLATSKAAVLTIAGHVGAMAWSMGMPEVTYKWGMAGGTLGLAYEVFDLGQMWLRGTATPVFVFHHALHLAVGGLLLATPSPERALVASVMLMQETSSILLNLHFFWGKQRSPAGWMHLFALVFYVWRVLFPGVFLMYHILLSDDLVGTLALGASWSLQLHWHSHPKMTTLQNEALGDLCSSLWESIRIR